MAKTAEQELKYHALEEVTWRQEGYWTVPEVSYRGETGTWNVFEKMTDSLNQEQLSELYEKEKQAGNPHPTDAPLIWAIADASYNLRKSNSEVAGFLNGFLRRGMQRWPNTLTKLIYISKGKDKVIHNVGTSDQYSVEGNVIGTERGITDVTNKQVLELLLGTKDFDKVNDVSQWINNTPFYIYSPDNKPKQDTERIVGFYAFDVRLNLVCDRNPLNRNPAFRILRVE